MKNYKRNSKSGRQGLEVLEDRRHLSSVAISGAVLNLVGDSSSNNSFIVRAASGDRVLGIANNQGQVASLQNVSEVVVHTGNDTDTVTVMQGVATPVEVITPSGQTSYVSAGQSQTFNGTPAASSSSSNSGSNSNSGSSTGAAGNSGSTSGSTGSGSSSSSSSNSSGNTTGSSTGTQSNNSGSSTSGSSNSGTTSSPAPAPTTPAGPNTPAPVITATTSTTVYPDQTVNVSATSSTFGDGTAINSTIAWNFGDAGSEYNSLVGFNAAHVYSTPGNYTITLTITSPDGNTATATQNVTVMADNRTTLYVSTSGSDSNNGLTPQTAVQTLARANQLMTSNMRVLLQSGDTFDTSVTNALNPGGMQNVYIGSYGTGAQPVIMYTGAMMQGALIGMSGTTVGLTVQGITFNSIYANNDDQNAIPSAFFPAGNQITIKDNTFLNLLADMNMNSNPQNVLVQDNTSPVAADLSGYFSWTQGNNLVFLGNYVAGSCGESTIRVGGANDVLFAYNNVTDTIKGTIAIQAGSYVYEYQNVLNDGPTGVGPLGVAGADTNASFNDCVFDSNTLNNCAILVEPGSNNTMIENNVMNENGNAGITINAQEVGGGFNWVSQNVYIQFNTVVDQGQWGGFLTINEGAAQGVHVNNNLFVDPTYQTGSGQGIITVDEDNLASFAEITDNVWAIPNASGFAQGGYFYVNATNGVQSGYLTPAQWEATGVATGDVYENVNLGNTYSVTADGFVAGSSLANA